MNNKKKYVAVWFNTTSNTTCVERIMAEDIAEAKLVMVYLMKYYGNNSYELKDIKYIAEESDYCVDYEIMLNKFRMAKKTIPRVNSILDIKGE